MTDASIVDRFFERSNKMDQDRYFTDDQWQFLADNSGGPGSVTNTLYFDTLSLKTQLPDWESAYLLLPLSIQAGSNGTDYADTPAYNLNTALALKASVLSLINSITINTGSGQNLVNDMDIHLVNNIKLLLDQSQNWVFSEGAQLCYAKDTVNSSAFTATTGNAGAYLRSQYMLNQCSFPGGGVINFNCVIPLRYIHSVFSALGMQINTHYQINFGLNFQSGLDNTSADGVAPTNLIHNFAPFTVNATTCYPKITVGYAGMPTSRIYYRNLKLSPHYAQKLADQMASGFKKTIYFTVSDVAPVSATDNGVGAGQVQKTVSPSTVRPLRLLALPTQAGALQSVLLPSPWILPCQLTQTQIQINNDSYFNNPLQNDYEHWQEVLRSMPGAGIDSQEGNQLNFQDFVGTQLIGGAQYKVYSFDIDRVKERLRSPNDAVSITFQSTKINSLANNDFRYIVERESAITFDFSTSHVSYAMGIPNH